MRISIGTLSKAFALSDEAIRFYEKKGLLHPHRQPDTGYRVFEMDDIQRIANVRRLKNQKFTLDEIHGIYRCTDLAQIRLLYEKKADELAQLIHRQRHILMHMNHCIQSFDEMESSLEKPMICDYGISYVLDFPSVEDMWMKLPKSALLKYLFQQLPLTSFTTMVGRDALTNGKYSLRKGVQFFEVDAEVLDVDLQLFRRIDATRSVGCLFRLINGKFDVNILLDKIRPFMEQHHLTASDDMFTSQLFSFVDRKERPVHYARLIVPVEADASAPLSS